ICLYYHLGLCPCPPVFDSSELKRDYKKNIKHIAKFLEGKSKRVLKDLEIERDKESKAENYEKAAKIQVQIDAIQIVTNPSYKLFEDEFYPNLKNDVSAKEESELIKVLKNTRSRVRSIRRIECYDISNIQGKYAVGSMTVLTNGQKDTSSYRKFKIRYTKNEPNDFAMMEEILVRRFNHPEWPFPDLLVVDGGKGQVSVALKVLNQKNLEIPLIGLAKREETIVTSDLKEINLSKDSPALLLIMRIRDEAHRFAITYHRNLRSKGFTGS
ncbi:MAG: UvrB/UvrC motif-containing protein, partial [Patescibacteria group bacterium]